MYVIICGVSNAYESYDFIRSARSFGWDVCVITTPMGERFVNSTELRDLTGHPVRSDYKHPNDPDVLPTPDALIVAPASFNSVNKIANGITDTLAVGVVCEAIGQGKPVIIAPWMNRALASHGAYRRSLEYLAEERVQVVLTQRTQPGKGGELEPGNFPWTKVEAALLELF
nr:flavoprotein [Kineosporia mesophila]